MSLSGLKDIDREVLKYVDDRELLKICSLDRKTWNEVCDDNFLRRRLTSRYPDIEKYKSQIETWKSFYLRFLYYISKLKEEYQFTYSNGNFENQYNLLKKYRGSELLIEGAKTGESDIVKYAIDKEGIRYMYETALTWASVYGHLQIVKYLVEHGADIHAFDDNVLIAASTNGRYDVVKYLVEKGANIHAKDDAALKSAVKYGQLPVIKYLLEHSVDREYLKNIALKTARKERQKEVIEYLKSFV